MSVPKEVIKSNDPARIASSLKKAALHQVHGGVSLVHVPQEVVAIIAKNYRSEKPKTFEEQEEDASTTRGVRLIKYARKVHDAIDAFIQTQIFCLGGFGCVASRVGVPDATKTVLHGLLRPKAEFMLLVRENVVQAVVSWAKAGSGKFGKKIVLQSAGLTAENKAKKSDRLYKLYKRHKLVEVDIIAGTNTAPALQLLVYVLSGKLAGKCAGVIIQSAPGSAFDATAAQQHGFKKVTAYAKKSDGKYADVLEHVPDAQYYALYDTPKCEDEKAKTWPAKLAEAFARNTVNLCQTGRKGYKADKLCTF